MSETNIEVKTITSLLWRFAERCGAQGVSFIVSIVLARVLLPEDYGTIALVTVFIAILQVFVDSGLGNALIQKKNADELDFSTVFYFNMFTCTILYLLMFFMAPYIAAFYENNSLVPVIRVLSLNLVISGLKNVQQAYVSKKMLFKRFFFATLGGTLGAAVIGIYLALSGYGIWALVIQQVFNTMVDTLILWITVKWRPKKQFSLSRLKILYKYGWKLLASALIDTVYNNLRQLLIGKLYTPTDLAFYNKGQQFPDLVITNVNSSIDSVLLPVMAVQQDNRIEIKRITQRAIRLSSYIIWPLMIGLMFTSKSVVLLILTEKWLPCVPFLMVFCFTFGFMPIHTANLNAIKAMGRSDYFLKLEIIKKIIGMFILLISINYGVMVMTYSLVLTTLTSCIINSYPNKELMNYTIFEQIKDIAPSMCLAFFMGLFIYPIQFLKLDTLVVLILQVLLGTVFYIGLSAFFKMDSFEYLIRTIKKILIIRNEAE